jgi:hypothetical protein
MQSRMGEPCETGFLLGSSSHNSGHLLGLKLCSFDVELLE